MSDVMLIALSGRVTRDPEVTVSPKGTQICKFDLACNSFSNGQKETHFFHIVCFSHNAEYVGKYARKGTLMTVSGMPTSKPYKDKQGNSRTNSDIIANVVSISPSGNVASQSNYDNATYDSTVENGGNFDSFNNNGSLDIDDSLLPF